MECGKDSTLKEGSVTGHVIWTLQPSKEVGMNAFTMETKDILTKSTVSDHGHC